MKYTKYDDYASIDIDYTDLLYTVKYKKFCLDFLNEISKIEDNKIEVTVDVATTLITFGYLDLCLPTDKNHPVYTDENYKMYVGNIGDKEFFVYFKEEV